MFERFAYYRLMTAELSFNGNKMASCNSPFRPVTVCLLHAPCLLRRVERPARVI